MIKLLRLIVVVLFAFLLLSACQNTSQPQKVDRLEIGTVYQSDGEFKLVDGKRFVRMINESSFDSEEKLKEFRTDNEDFTFYPNIYFAEGTYEKVGDDYQLKILKSVKVEFKNVANIKKKIISTRIIKSNPTKKYMSLSKEEGYYTFNKKIPLKSSDQKIPDSIDEFLAQYQYEPDELD
ncbi:hypothetical protein [uncultured Streptococcus sp.]|uniref:hypothetical protein n=1 Tax=uncultured Streptococcus sp. TaxID=83427 RepID=UPI0025EF904F|nr:hypothetical protein [uncultured Streptococcus sp.]